MKIYTATIYGHKFYFTGNLMTEAIKAVEFFCKQLESDANNTDPQELFTFLLNHIESYWDCSVTPMNIEHIFRINF